MKIPDDAYACYDCSDNSTAFFSKSLSFASKFSPSDPFYRFGDSWWHGHLDVYPEGYRG